MRSKIEAFEGKVARGDARPPYHRGMVDRSAETDGTPPAAERDLSLDGSGERSPPPSVAADAGRALREARRWSGVPVAVSLALVGFSVLFGVYGPRVVDRGAPSIGTPLWEAADAAVEYLDWFAMGFHSQGAEQVPVGEVNATLWDLLRVASVCPDLSSHEFHPLRPQPFNLPGASSAAVVIYVRDSSPGREYLALIVAPFSEQYTLFSEFGQPRFLAPGGAIGVEAAPAERVSSAALAWTNGSVVYVAVGSRKTTLGDVAADLVPAMAGDANSATEGM